MSVPVNTEVAWAAGLGTPIKGSININSVIDAVQDGEYATFTWHGTATCSNHPYNSMNVWACSDFATWCKGEDLFNRANNGCWTDWCYQHDLPYTGNMYPTDNILLQFRLDTGRYYGPNSMALWAQSGGYIIPLVNTEATITAGFSFTWGQALTRRPEQVVLSYNTSGATSSYDHQWINCTPFLYVRSFMEEGSINFDYRPGERKVSNDWWSHERNGGWAERKAGSWQEMRTMYGGRRVGDPPERKINGQWLNQSWIGKW